ncbi:hypothetical protein AAHE18_02G055800 [Arachis hypogaea]
MFLTLWTPPSPQNHLASRSDPSEAKFGSPFSQINHDARLLRTIGLAKQKEGLYYLIVNAMKDKPTTTLGPNLLNNAITTPMTNKNICNISGSGGGKSRRCTMHDELGQGSVSARCLLTFAMRVLQLIGFPMKFLHN